MGPEKAAGDRRKGRVIGMGTVTSALTGLSLAQNYQAPEITRSKM